MKIHRYKNRYRSKVIILYIYGNAKIERVETNGDKYFSQGSVATGLRCGGILIMTLAEICL